MWQYNHIIAYEALCKASAACHICRHSERRQPSERRCTSIPELGGLDSSEALAAFAENLEQMGLDYVDHLMVHQPGDWADTHERSNPGRRQKEWLAQESIHVKDEAFVQQHPLLFAAYRRPVVKQPLLGHDYMDDVVKKHDADARRNGSPGSTETHRSDCTEGAAREVPSMIALGRKASLQVLWARCPRDAAQVCQRGTSAGMDRSTWLHHSR